MNGDYPRKTTPKPADLVSILRSSPVHSALTPVGTPEMKPRSAGSMHKVTSTGKTVDIMILPRGSSEDRFDREQPRKQQQQQIPTKAANENLDENSAVPASDSIAEQPEILILPRNEDEIKAAVELQEYQQQEEQPSIVNGKAEENDITPVVASLETASLDSMAQRPKTTEQKKDEKMSISSIDATIAQYDGAGMTGAEFLKNLPEGVFACPFLMHGCHKAGDELDVKLHIRDDSMLHLMQLCRAVIELRRLRLKMLQDRANRLSEIDNNLLYPIMVIKKYGDQCIFRIKNINRMIQQARFTRSNILLSEPFETHRFGYKMTVMVAPYGDAEVARQYLSVYVTLIKGDYDAILRWPFTHPMTFTAHATNAADDLVRKFTPNPIPQNLPFLGRPATRNAAFGIQRFCKLMDVDKYSIEGDFFLSVHVDLSSLDREPTPRMPSDDL